MWARYKAKGTNLDAITSLAQQRAFAQNFHRNRASDVSNRVVDADDSWDLEGMTIAEEVAVFHAHAKSREIQSVCEEGVVAVPTAVIKMIVLARDGIEDRRKNTRFSERSTDTQANS